MVMISFHILLLVALVKMVLVTGKPGLTAGIHAFGYAVFDLIETAVDVAAAHRFARAAAELVGEAVGEVPAFPWLAFLRAGRGHSGRARS